MTPADFALLAQAAYDDAPDIGLAKGPSSAIVRQTEAGTVIAIPGTDSFSDLLADFAVTPNPVPFLGPVHGGFWAAYAGMKEQIIEAAAGGPVTFVGHSLGAAIATLAAADFRANDNAVAAVYAFAPPRVSPGSLVAVALQGTPVYQYRKGNDIVPTVPPTWFHGAVSIIQIGQASLPFLNLKDHALAGYIAALQNGQNPTN